MRQAQIKTGLFALAILAIVYQIIVHTVSTSLRSAEVVEDEEVTELPRESFRLTNADNDTTLHVIDNALLRFMRSESLLGGASVAVSYRGRLVYAKGLGYSDLADSIEMQPYNIMRVASVSKLITAVAVMKLYEAGWLDLDQKVFGREGILNDSIYLNYKDRRFEEVTVYQLLNHSGGWTARWGDPMFMPNSIAMQTNKSLPISMQDILLFMQEKRVHFSPGSGSVYSNFGYGLLGLVIEKVAGTSYEEFVKSQVLEPLGIFDMQIGHSHLEDRLPREVLYYELDTTELVPDFATGKPISRRAYGATDIHTLGAAGGWVASASDLLKLVLTIDGLQSIPDQLTTATVDTMTHHAEAFDPIGWRTTAGDCWYRTGTLAATSAIIGRLDNEVCYVVLLNCSNYRGPNLASMLKLCMNRAIERIDTWPEVDLLADDVAWQRYLLKEHL